jgi:hypothetical protein
MTLEAFYGLNPVGVIDRDKWTLKEPEVMIAFRENAIYTPLIDWTPTGDSGATSIENFELMEGEADSEAIPMTANYVDAMGIDSRSRKWTVERHGDKVQMHKSSNYFTQWRNSGGRDWRPILRALLANNIVQKTEALARKVWFQGSKSYWTFAGAATNFQTIGTNDRFALDLVNAWNLRLGYTGSPIIPGEAASAKIAIIPPGARYDILNTLASASNNMASLWRDASTNVGKLNNEIGEFQGVRFVEAPSNKFGINPNVLYNAGAITKQYGVVEPIRMGDGAPDPDGAPVDGVWYVGQKGATHTIKLETAAADLDFAVNDVVTIHVATTTDFGVTNGVNPFHGKTIQRRVVAYDHTANTLTFDRPVMFNYTSAFSGTSVSGGAGTFYAYVTKGRNIGFALVLGSRGGVSGRMHKPIEFYEPRPIDDFDSVWRFSWDMIAGWNVADPNFYQLHFFNVSVPKPGGIG